MSVDHIRYDLLTQQALRAVVRRVLIDISKTGVLPGEHHFYITFDTRAAGVRISKRLHEQYPEEMTIVLQHQFWGLEIGEESFSVTLSFNNRQERLTVPIEAIAGFADPAVKFVLQFEATELEEGEAAKPVEKVAASATRKPSAAAAATNNGADVVTLDAFRKK